MAPHAQAARGAALFEPCEDELNTWPRGRPADGSDDDYGLKADGALSQKAAELLDAMRQRHLLDQDEFRKGVEAGCREFLAPVGAETFIPDVIRNDEHDIWFLRFRLDHGSGQQKHRKQEGYNFIF